MPFVSNLGIAFAEVARANHSRTALLYPGDGRHVTYGELSQLAQQQIRKPATVFGAFPSSILIIQLV